ncbi:MAG: transporter substrate-binding domain-containing protein, partial [Granulosicoccus sp.]
MKQLSLSAIAISLGLFSLNGSAQDCPEDLPTVEAGKLTMSINATLPPRQYIDASGELKGMHPDLGNEIAKRLCLEPVYTNVPFEVQIPGLA